MTETWHIVVLVLMGVLIAALLIFLIYLALTNGTDASIMKERQQMQRYNAGPMDQTGYHDNYDETYRAGMEQGKGNPYEPQYSPGSKRGPRSLKQSYMSEMSGYDSRNDYASGFQSNPGYGGPYDSGLDYQSGQLYSDRGAGY